MQEQLKSVKCILTGFRKILYEGGTGPLAV